MSSTLKLAAILSLSLVAMSCSPKHQDSQQQNANGTAGAAMSGPNFRVACGNEIEKYCANDPRKRRCLLDNMDKLGDACKTAVNTPRNGANGHGRGIGRICADDIQKFCANDPRKFHCLKTNLGQLSDACRAAFTAPRDANPQQGSQPANGNP